jgi:uncharacterized membrane protein
MDLYEWATNRHRVSKKKGFYVLFCVGAVLLLIGVAFLVAGTFRTSSWQFSDAFGLAYIPIGIFFLYRAMDGAREGKSKKD